MPTIKTKRGKEYQHDTRDANGNPISPVNGQPTPVHRPITPQNAREYQKKAMQSIREKRSIANAFKERLTMEFTDDKGNKMSGAEIIAMSIYKGANNGNAKMVEIALGLLGEKPAETVNVNMPDPDVMAEIRKRMEADSV